MEKYASINPIYPHGTNSTMFTSCCDIAICSDELRCPSCGALIDGWEAETDYKRSRIRWSIATRFWNRK